MRAKEKPGACCRSEGIPGLETGDAFGGSTSWDVRKTEARCLTGDVVLVGLCWKWAKLLILSFTFQIKNRSFTMLREFDSTHVSPCVCMCNTQVTTWYWQK